MVESVDLVRHLQSSINIYMYACVHSTHNGRHGEEDVPEVSKDRYALCPKQSPPHAVNAASLLISVGALCTADMGGIVGVSSCSNAFWEKYILPKTNQKKIVYHVLRMTHQVMTHQTWPKRSANALQCKMLSWH